MEQYGNEREQSLAETALIDYWCIFDSFLLRPAEFVRAHMHVQLLHV